MKRIKGFQEFNRLNEAGIFSRGAELLKKAGNWLMNLIRAEKEGEIPVRDKKYNPETGRFEQFKDANGNIAKARSVVKVYLPEGDAGSSYNFRSGSISSINLT